MTSAAELAHELRQLLNEATRSLRKAEDLTRLDPHWGNLPTADRIRSIYEQITEDLLNGTTWRPPLVERLSIAEGNLQLAMNKLEELGELDDLLPAFK